ncbi:MAG: hypothetical protein PHY90_03100 [Desulfitobacteriaceae bacterium]|jgi:hypothetical protein|nr:hypothetical protein [Desulfitobacteriaceae bacterium]
MGQAKYDREFKEFIVQKILNKETATTEMTREIEPFENGNRVSGAEL